MFVIQSARQTVWAAGQVRGGEMSSRRTYGWRRPVLGAGLAALAVAAAACGSSNSDGSAASGGGKGGSILIGAIAGTTGAYGSTGVAVINGAKMAVADVNAKGGINGKQLKLTSANDNASAT